MTKPQVDKRNLKANFVPKRVADEDDETQSLRPSILFLGLALCLTLGIAVWLGLVDTNDEIRLEIRGGRRKLFLMTLQVHLFLWCNEQ